MRFEWKDGAHVRSVQVVSLGSGRYRVTLDGAEQEVEAERDGADVLRLRGPAGETVAEITAVGARRFVRLGTMDFVLEREAAGRRRRDAAHGGGLEAPMPGQVTRVMVAAGDAVKKGQPLVAVEAMKMEHMIRAPRDGKVRSVAVQAGAMVGGGEPLVELED